MPVSLECDSEIDEEELEEAWRDRHCHTCNGLFPSYGPAGVIGQKHMHPECTRVFKRSLCFHCYWDEYYAPLVEQTFPSCAECDATTLEKTRTRLRDEMSEIAILLIETKFCTFQ